MLIYNNTIRLPLYKENCTKTFLYSVFARVYHGLSFKSESLQPANHAGAHLSLANINRISPILVVNVVINYRGGRGFKPNTWPKETK